MSWTRDEQLAFDFRMALSKIAGLRLTPEARDGTAGMRAASHCARHADDEVPVADTTCVCVVGQHLPSALTALKLWADEKPREVEHGALYVSSRVYP